MKDYIKGVNKCWKRVVKNLSRISFRFSFLLKSSAVDNKYLKANKIVSPARFTCQTWYFPLAIKVYMFRHKNHNLGRKGAEWSPSQKYKCILEYLVRRLLSTATCKAANSQATINARRTRCGTLFTGTCRYVQLLTIEHNTHIVLANFVLASSW